MKKLKKIWLLIIPSVVARDGNVWHWLGFGVLCHGFSVSWVLALRLPEKDDLFVIFLSKHDKQKAYNIKAHKALMQPTSERQTGCMIWVLCGNLNSNMFRLSKAAVWRKTFIYIYMYICTCTFLLIYANFPFVPFAETDYIKTHELNSEYSEEDVYCMYCMQCTLCTPRTALYAHM